MNTEETKVTVAALSRRMAEVDAELAMMRERLRLLEARSLGVDAISG